MLTVFIWVNSNCAQTFSPIFTKEKSKKILILSFWGMGDSIQQTPIFLD